MTRGGQSFLGVRAVTPICGVEIKYDFGRLACAKSSRATGSLTTPSTAAISAATARTTPTIRSAWTANRTARRKATASPDRSAGLTVRSPEADERGPAGEQDDGEDVDERPRVAERRAAGSCGSPWLGPHRPASRPGSPRHAAPSWPSAAPATVRRPPGQHPGRPRGRPSRVSHAQSAPNRARKASPAHA
jgi:hypothetical protein